MQNSEADTLDLARGMAALVVVAAHLRSFAFVDGHLLNHPGLAWKLFYLLTSLGHQSVMVFFVLSGYLVGGGVYRALGKGAWSWRTYAIKRLSRLYIVLVPALVLTLALDWTAIAATHSAFYSGGLDALYSSGPPVAESAALYRPATFLGNLAFLQTIAVPRFGCNGPLWSLANEFWYYVLFPLAACAAWKRLSPAPRIACAIVFCAACAALPPPLVGRGLIWLMGVAVAVLEDWRPQWLSLRTRPVLRAAALLVFAVSVVIPSLLRVPDSFAGDMAIGAAFTAVLFLWRTARVPAIVAGPVRGLADMSYSLYLTHFPFLACLACVVLGNARMPPGAAGAAIFASGLCACLAYSALIYAMFERHTARIQAVLLRRFTARADKPHATLVALTPLP